MTEKERSMKNDSTVETPYRPCVVLDFDKVMHSYDKGWQNGIIYGDLDFEGIKVAWEEGYAVAIVTTRDPRSVCNILPDDMYVVTDLKCEFLFWNGGITGREILITNRKIAAVAYVDDRGVNHVFGDDWDTTFSKVNYLRDRDKS